MRFALGLGLCSVLACNSGPYTMASGSSEEGSSSGSGGDTTTTSGGLATTTLETTTMTAPMTTGPGTTEMESSSGGTTTAPPDLCTDHPGPDACCCFWSDGGQHKVECPTTPLCAGMTIEVLCTDDAMAPECASGAVEVTSEEGLDCALAALAAGSAGALRYTLTSKADPGAWKQEWDLYLQGDGTAYIRTLKVGDGGSEYEPLERWALEEGSSFMKCMGQDVVTRIDCLRTVTVGAASEQCLEGSEF
jgi:hypothetical protein